MSKVLNFGLLGFGSMGKTHLYSVMSVPYYYLDCGFSGRYTSLCTSRLETAEDSAEYCPSISNIFTTVASIPKGRRDGSRTPTFAVRARSLTSARILLICAGTFAVILPRSFQKNRLLFPNTNAPTAVSGKQMPTRRRISLRH